MAKVLPNGKQQYFDSNGDPLAGGKVYTYASGTTTPKATYADAGETALNTNPIILNARGEASVFWNGTYTVTVKDSLDNTIYSVDGVSTSTDAADVDYGLTTIGDIFANHAVYCVDTMASLPSVDSTQWSYVFVAGYYAAGDGGGGMYYLDSADTTSTDNSGTVIVGTDNARWKLFRTGPVTAKQFGCIDDGFVTDCTALLQNAIDSVVGEPIIIDGAFYIANEITLSYKTGLKGLNQYSGLRTDGEYTRSNFKSVLALGQTSGIKIAQETVSDILIISSNYTEIGDYPLPLTLANTTAAYAAFFGYAFKSENATTVNNDLLNIPTIQNCIVAGFMQFVNIAASGAVIVRDCLVDCRSGIWLEQNLGVYSGTLIDNCQFVFALNKDAANGSYTAVTPTDYGVKTEGPVTICNSVFDRHATGIITTASTGANVAASNSVFATTAGITAGATTYVSLTNCTVTGAIVSSADRFSIVGGYCDTIQNDAGYMSIVGARVGAISGSAAAKVENVYKLEAHTPTEFTPALEFGGGTTGITYSVQKGWYVKKDNVITGSARITLSNKGSSTGAAKITGLPVASSSSSGSFGMTSINFYDGMNASVTKGFFGSIEAGATKITLYNGGASATTPFTDADLTNSADISISFTYMIDR